jgi:hypothetical protein
MLILPPSCVPWRGEKAFITENMEEIDDTQAEQEELPPEEVAIKAEPELEIAAPLPADLDPVLEKELQAVVVPEPEITKTKQQLSEDMIQRPLRPDDLFDEGSI